ncbi:hypothetical protein HG530_014464 [Fusarium avenaceum]|nr:hypothetical protein HG530_014464 [Fusarium avenaceum]
MLYAGTNKETPDLINIHFVDRTLLEATVEEALLNAECDALGDSSADLVDILTSNALAECSSNDIVAEGKGLVGNLTGAEILRGKGGNESGRLALGVVLGVNRTLVEGSHHVGCKLSADDTALSILV